MMWWTKPPFTALNNLSRYYYYYYYYSQFVKAIYIIVEWSVRVLVTSIAKKVFFQFCNVM